jgi:PAP2 superfamily
MIMKPYFSKDINLLPNMFGVMIVAALTIAHCGYVSTAAAQSSLRGENSSELERLLAVQSEKTAVPYSFTQPPRVPVNALDRYFMWNEIALDTTAIDHTPVDPASGEDPCGFGEQLGPHRSSYAMAIVHIAMFDAVNAISYKYMSYSGVAPVHGNVSLDRAIAQAAYDALITLYPFQSDRLRAIFEQDIARIHGVQRAINAGADLGDKAANAIIEKRKNDGSELPEPRVGVDFFPSTDPGKWQPDPISGLKVALGGNWSKVKPFVMTSADQFRSPKPPELTDNSYTKAYLEVAGLGGDPAHGTSTNRTEPQTFTAKFWSYDGTPSLCAPPRLYNQIARTVALKQQMRDVVEIARLFALINVAMADAGISAWEAKYTYQYWRPVTGIRAGDTDGNPSTFRDTNWYPLGAQATNSHGPNFTPPFPAYPSGHATFGGALFEIMRKFWPDNTPFTFVSDEYNGKNRDIDGNLRPLRPVVFKSFSEAEFDNAKSRIFMGVHWQFDADAGIKQGNQVGDYVFDHAFRPRHVN